MDNYLKILEESLRKKLQLLDQIADYNERQREIFRSEKAAFDQFDESIEEKGKLIDQITKLDDGFEKLYAGVAEELKGNKDKYAQQIKKLQLLVQQVTDKSVAVQAQEVRNKELIEEYFARERANIRQGRRNSKAAYNYYSNVNKSAYLSPQFLDSKQ